MFKKMKEKVKENGFSLKKNKSLDMSVKSSCSLG